jgi:hypothetical protein
MPTGCLIRQAVLHDEANRHGHDAMRVMGFGCSQVGHVGVEILAALAAFVLRIGEQDIARPTVGEIAEIMQGSRENLVSATTFVATGATPMQEVSTAFNDFRFGQILRVGDAFRRIRQVFAGAEHDKVLLDQKFLAQRIP